MSYIDFQSDLKKLGLSDKEAAVYLSLLGQGPSTVLHIARKSKVARATTYLVLDALQDSGLVSRVQENGKVFFIAEQPGQLSVLLDKKEQDITRERGNLQELLPKLRAFMQSAGEHPTARYYSGVEGLKVIRSEMLMYSKAGDAWYQFAPVDHMRRVFPQDDALTYAKQRRAKKVRSKAIISSSDPQTRKMLEETADSRWSERKFVNPKHCNSSSGFSVYRDRVVISDYGKTVGGVVLESKPMADMMREMFLLLWSYLD